MIKVSFEHCVDRQSVRLYVTDVDADGVGVAYSLTDGDVCHMPMRPGYVCPVYAEMPERIFEAMEEAIRGKVRPEVINIHVSGHKLVEIVRDEVGRYRGGR